MSSEIHKLFREQFPTVHRLQETSLGDIHNLKYVEWLEMSFQSERLSHEETKKRLEALEDAIEFYDTYKKKNLVSYETIGKANMCLELIHKHQMNSRARKQNDA